MATATVCIATVQGYAGPARCFELDPPYAGSTYVTICATPGFGGVVRPEVGVYPATETGACTEMSLMRRPGSFVLHDEPDTPERIDGAFALALLLAGGYQVTEPVQDAAP